MLVLRDRESIGSLPDVGLRDLIHERLQLLAEDCDDHCDLLDEVVMFVVMEAGDSVPDLDSQLGTRAMGHPSDDTSFGEPGYAPAFELVEDHGSHFEVVYVLSSSGFGAEVFIPKVPGIPAELLAMCSTYAGSTGR